MSAPGASPFPFNHNGGPPVSPFDDIPPGIQKMHFFKCDIVALRKAIFDKPLDIRGAFISALLAMYEHMEPLPADDNIARMRCGIYDMRVYRRVKKMMLELGLVQTDYRGRITSARFEEEVTAYITEFRNRQAAAQEREDERRKAPKKPRSQKSGPIPSEGDNRLATAELSDSYGLAKPELTASSATATAELKADLSEKVNEINGDAPTAEAQEHHNEPLRARVLELELESIRTINQSKPPECAHDAGEGPIDYRVAQAIRIMAEIKGSATDPDHEWAWRACHAYAETYGADAVLEAAADYRSALGMHRERRDVDDAIFARYCRQARKNIDREDKPVEEAPAKAQIKDDSCWWDEDRLMVANGFKAELLELVGGSEQRLRLTLDKAAASVPLEAKGTLLRKVVRSQFTRHAEWGQQDERKVSAVERRNAPAGDPTAKTETVQERMARLLAQSQAAKGGAQ